MKCLIKNVTILLVVAVAIAGFAGWIPQEWGGYATAGVMASIGLVAVVLILRGVFRNTYRNLGRMTHEQSTAIRADIRAGLGIITDEQPQLQDREITVRTGKMAPDSNRPVMVDRAHIQHIRASEPRETMPFAGYDKAPAKISELTAGQEADGIEVDFGNKSPVWRNNG